MDNPSHLSDPLRKRLTLLHTSDLHVGSDANPEKALLGFDAALDKACQVSVDALIIAGDLFDALRVPTDVVTYVLRSLEQVQRPVVVLPGNHDTLLTSPSSPFPFNELPSNLIVLREPDGELVTIGALGLSIWGRPVYNHEPSFRPLAGLPPRPDGGWYVAIAHGLVVDRSLDMGWSSPINLEELAQADCDYIALGHVHLFEEVTQGGAPAFYSGATAETRRPTVALVTMDPSKGVTAQAIPLDHVAPGVS